MKKVTMALLAFTALENAQAQSTALRTNLIQEPEPEPPTVEIVPPIAHLPIA